MSGFASQDNCIFGAETLNRVREVDTITDFSFAAGEIFLDQNAADVRSVKNISGGLQITLTGDGDVIKVVGTGLNGGNIVIHDHDTVL